MGNPMPTKVHFFQACYFCLLAIFCPRKLEIEEENDNKQRTDFPKSERSKAKIVNHAFWTSFLMIALFALVGGFTGVVFRCVVGEPESFIVSALQIVGALLLLWGTLFVRGFDILTWGSVTLSERVNQWLYRTMYCVGTAIIVFSLVWSSWRLGG